MKKRDKHTTIRTIAAILMIGGVAGLFAGAFSISQLLVQPVEWKSILFSLTFFTVFGLCIWTGVELWAGKPRAFAWAKEMFAIQIPYISIPAVSYQCYTAAGLFLSYIRSSENKIGFELEFGSQLRFWMPSGDDNLVIGTNVIAIACLAVLIKASQRHSEASLPVSSATPTETI